MTWRAEPLVFTRAGRVEVQTEVLPAPGPGRVLVASHVSAISAGTERLAFRGELPPDLAVDDTLESMRAATFAYPFRFGYATVGHVVACGERVPATDLGRRVFAFHPHASLCDVARDDAIPIPDGVDDERAALLASMETAVNLVLDGAPLLGERVLLLGQGVVGLLTTFLLGRFPLEACIAVEGRARRAALARALGATEVVHPNELAADGDVSRVEGRPHARFAGARGADLIYELTGDPAVLNDAIALAGYEARIVLGSWYGGRRAAIDLGGAFHRRRLRLLSSQVSHLGGALGPRWDRARRFEAAWRALAALPPAAALVSHRFPFAEAQSAYELLSTPGADVAQVLLTHAAPGPAPSHPSPDRRSP